jgi:signal transduction histidine kinase/CheY-like chemotaxis protein
MTSQSARRREPTAAYPHRVAFSVQVDRNVILQVLGMGMVALMGLGAFPWPVVLAWTLTMLAIAIAEQNVLRRVGHADPASKAADRWAPALRFASTTLYAAAALALIVKGDAGERLFAFALMSASTINVLMRYYRSPLVLIVSLSPYIAILVGVAFTLARSEWRDGDVLGVVASGFTLAIFGLQLWSARAQLAAAWRELATREHAADAANRAKSQFLATMSHELRTPLNGVLGMAQVLAAEPLTPEQKDRVKVIRRSGETLLAVVNDLLDLSKIEAGALSLEVDEFDLEHLVRGVAAAYRPRAEKQGLTFDFEIGAAARGLYRGDTARVRRILYGLCDNAVKFTPAGGVVLKAGHDGGGLVFQVSDTGIGIGDADLPHLFDGFFQVDGSFTRKYDGAGVGLAICRELSRLMGGEIDAVSRLGEGSTFTVRLPLERAVAAVARAPAAPPAGGDSDAPELRILAAEDNLTNQLVLKTLLAAAGLEPVFAADGREALAAWEGQTWDLLLMDIQMPRMNGIEATQAIRRRERQIARPYTPIIAVTANAMTHQVSEYLAAGMDGVVTKPVDLVTLLGAMEKALSPDVDAAQARAAS